MNKLLLACVLSLTLVGCKTHVTEQHHVSIVQNACAEHDGYSSAYYYEYTYNQFKYYIKCNDGFTTTVSNN